MSKASIFWPGKYSTRLAKALENDDNAETSARHEDAIESQYESSKSTQTEREVLCLARMGNLEAVVAASLYISPTDR